MGTQGPMRADAVWGGLVFNVITAILPKENADTLALAQEALMAACDDPDPAP